MTPSPTARMHQRTLACVAAPFCAIALACALGMLAGCTGEPAPVEDTAPPSNASSQEFTGFETIQDAGMDEASPELALEETPAPQAPAYDVTPEDIAALDASDDEFTIITLNSADTEAPSALSSASADALENALSFYEDAGYTCGFLTIDLDSGRAIARDVDARVYGASAFKGPFALFICETQLDPEKVMLETYCPEGVAASYLKGEPRPSNEVGDLIQESVVSSSNDCYRILRANFDGAPLRAWLEELGLDSAIADDTWFPRYNARESAIIWLRMHEYLGSTGTHAAWLRELLKHTEDSFVRDGIEESCAERGVAAPVVLSKAGWIAGTGYYNATCDAALFEYEGRTYLTTIMTSAPDCVESQEAITALARALFDAGVELSGPQNPTGRS